MNRDTRHEPIIKEELPDGLNQNELKQESEAYGAQASHHFMNELGNFEVAYVECNLQPIEVLQQLNVKNDRGNLQTLHNEIKVEQEVQPSCAEVFDLFNIYVQVSSQPINNVVEKYQSLLKQKYDAPGGTARKTFVGNPGLPNRHFFITLFTDDVLAITFLQETGLITNKLKCPKCESDMRLQFIDKEVDLAYWECCKRKKDSMCPTRSSIRTGSIFSRINLCIDDIMLLTYEILHETSYEDIVREYPCTLSIVREWSIIVNDDIMFHLEKSSEQVGGADIVVYLYERVFKKGRYYKGSITDGQRVLFGFEKKTGKCFVAPLEDRTQGTFLSAIKMWIKRGTSVMSDLPRLDIILKEFSIKDLKENHSITVSDIWSNEFKPSDQSDAGSVAKRVFCKQCESNKTDRMNTYLELIRSTSNSS